MILGNSKESRKDTNVWFSQTQTQRPSNCCMKQAELPTLLDRRLQDIALLMYKVKHGLYQKNVCDLFTVNCSPYSLRGSHVTVPRFYSVTYGKYCLRYLGPKFWQVAKHPNIQKTNTKSTAQSTAGRWLPELLPPLQ